MPTIGIVGGRVDVGGDYSRNLGAAANLSGANGNQTNPGPNMGYSTTSNRIPLAAGDKIKVPDDSVIVKHYNLQKDEPIFRFRGVETPIADGDFTGEPSNSNAWDNGIIAGVMRSGPAIWTYHNVYIVVNERTAPMLASAGYITAVNVGDGYIYYQNPPPQEANSTQDTSGALNTLASAAQSAGKGVTSVFASLAVIAIVAAAFYFLPRTAKG